MINSASSINIVKKFIPLCSTISTKQPCEAISMSLTKKFHVLNLTHNISNSNSSYNYPSSTVMRCSSEFPSRPIIEDQPPISTPTEIPKIDLPPEFEVIPPVPEITQPTPELPGSNPGPEFPFPCPPIPSPATPDIPLPLPPDGLPPPPPREVPPPPSTPTPLDEPPPDITPRPVRNFV